MLRLVATVAEEHAATHGLFDHPIALQALLDVLGDAGSFYKSTTRTNAAVSVTHVVQCSFGQCPGGDAESFPVCCVSIRCVQSVRPPAWPGHCAGPIASPGTDPDVKKLRIASVDRQPWLLEPAYITSDGLQQMKAQLSSALLAHVMARGSDSDAGVSGRQPPQQHHPSEAGPGLGRGALAAAQQDVGAVLRDCVLAQASSTHYPGSAVAAAVVKARAMAEADAASGTTSLTCPQLCTALTMRQRLVERCSGRLLTPQLRLDAWYHAAGVLEDVSPIRYVTVCVRERR